MTDRIDQMISIVERLRAARQARLEAQVDLETAQADLVEAQGRYSKFSNEFAALMAQLEAL